jgi:hypothetical protein
MESNDHPFVRAIDDHVTGSMGVSVKFDLQIMRRILQHRGELPSNTRRKSQRVGWL